MKRESGQALVLVLLSLAIVLTIVLFVVSRSVTDIAVSTRQQESIRAFSAAEAGVEKSLVVGVGSSGSFSGSDSNYDASVTDFSVGTKTFNYPIQLSSGDSMTVWLVSHDANGNLVCGTNPCFSSTGTTLMSVCWGKPGTPTNADTTPAIEVSAYYESTPGDLTTLKVGRGAFDHNANGSNTTHASNSFTSASSGSCTIGNVTYGFAKTILFSDLGIPASAYGTANGLQFVRIKMLYNTDVNQPIGISVNQTGNSNLPSQGQDITSTGIAGGSNRRISVFQSWPEIPSIFEYSIYSSGGLTK